MIEIGYLGGFIRRGHHLPAPPAGHTVWRWLSPEHEAFLHAGGTGCQLYDHGTLAVLIRGAVVDCWSRAPRDTERLAQRIVDVYREQGTLHIDGLEGSFTLALIDGPGGRVLVYRNLVGDHNTYYHQPAEEVWFGSNLADLVRASGAYPRPNDDDLPTLFLNRTIPGRNTLFSGFHRLLPGEQITHKEGQLFPLQRRTLGDLRELRPIGKDALDRLEAVMTQVCADYHAMSPDAAVLLSGGVDSSFVQLHWNRIRPEGQWAPRSFCVAVDHERTRGDLEYAESASRMLGTSHSAIFADAPYDQYLLETVTTTGELPNHVQLAYYPALARAMSAQGIGAGLNGDGADSLFGLALATPLQHAALLRRLFPAQVLRRGGATLARWLRCERLRDSFSLADHLHDYERLDHPVNRAAVFADWSAVEKCFGREAVENVAASRRALLDRYHVPDTPLDRLHAAGFLGSAMNTAALTATLYARWGVRLFSPFLDSRMLRLAVNLSPRQRFRFRQPKALLKSSLERHGFAELAYRRKKSFGQPIFEWLAPGGVLHPHVAAIDSYPFVDAAALAESRARPTWFLYSLLCYDLWSKKFVRRNQSLSSTARAA